MSAILDRITSALPRMNANKKSATFAKYHGGPSERGRAAPPMPSLRSATCGNSQTFLKYDDYRDCRRAAEKRVQTTNTLIPTGRIGPQDKPSASRKRHYCNRAPCSFAKGIAPIRTPAAKSRDRSGAPFPFGRQAVNSAQHPIANNASGTCSLQ